MKDKLNKVYSVYKKYGFIGMTKKLIRYINSNYFSKINIFSNIMFYIEKDNIKQELEKIFNSDNYDRIIIWRGKFGWNVPLFQRPQHIANNLSKQKCLMFYEVTKFTDKVSTIRKQKKNLYLVNLNNRLFKKMLFKYIQSVEIPKYIQIYSTDWEMSINELKNYIYQGYKIIYEYIDDLSPVLSGTRELPINIKEKYEYMLSDKDNVFVIVTANELEKDILAKRGKEKLVFACNGVDYEHFQQIDEKFEYIKEFKSILDEKKHIIGYYGAMASWFDYDMIKHLAKNRPQYNIVLIGAKYDDSIDKSGIEQYENIHFMGTVEYNVLQNYASKFSVCTIPFIINDITKATSPLKLFEYMALNKPIVTTAMNECKKYKSVMIANNKEEFVELVDKAINIGKSNDGKYLELLKKEAQENTWEGKTEKIVQELKKIEKPKRG